MIFKNVIGRHRRDAINAMNISVLMSTHWQWFKLRTASLRECRWLKLSGGEQNFKWKKTLQEWLGKWTCNLKERIWGLRKMEEVPSTAPFPRNRTFKMRTESKEPLFVDKERLTVTSCLGGRPEFTAFPSDNEFTTFTLPGQLVLIQDSLKGPV